MEVVEAVKESSGGGEWRVAGSDYDCPVTARLGLGVDTTQTRLTSPGTVMGQLTTSTAAFTLW